MIVVRYDTGDSNGHYGVYETNHLVDFQFEPYAGNRGSGFIADGSEETHSTGRSYYETSGVCGDNITWQVKNDELILSGTGWTWCYSFQDSDNPPWFNVRNSIERVKISESITDIGDHVFDSLHYLKSVVIPKSLNTINNGAFLTAVVLRMYTIVEVKRSGLRADFMMLVLSRKNCRRTGPCI